MVNFTPFFLINPATGKKLGLISGLNGFQKRTTIDCMPKKKEYMPRMGNRLDKNLWLAYLDFDKLPEGFDTFEGLEIYLGQFRELCVFTSFSGKPKAIIKITGKSWNKRNIIATLRKFLPEELIRAIDLQGLSHSFVVPTQENMHMIQQFLDNVAPVIMVEDYSLWVESGYVKQYENLNDVQNRLLHAIHCMKGQMDVPVQFWGEHFKVSASMVSRYLRDMVEKGYLRLEDKGYKVGLKAKRYISMVFSSVSFSVQSSLGQDAFSYLLNLTKSSDLPNEIQDGEWFTSLWAATRCFDSGKKFMGWVMSLPNVLKAGKSRLAKARSAWKSHAKRNGLPALESAYV